MSAFWESLHSANLAAIETMGETVIMGGLEICGVVDPLAYEETAGAGGRREVVSALILVPSSTALLDGMPVRLRGVDAAVASWQQLGPGGEFLVRVGPLNRWGGDFPGA